MWKKGMGESGKMHERKEDERKRKTWESWQKYVKV